MRKKLLICFMTLCMVMPGSLTSLAAAAPADTDTNTAAAGEQTAGLTENGVKESRTSNNQENYPVIQMEEETDIQTVVVDDILPESDELFEGYMNQELYPPSQSGRKKAKAKNRRSALSETDGKIYDALLERISQVADGKLSSTEFRIPVTAIFGDEILNKYSAADLGVSAIVENGALTTEAKNALFAKIQFNLSSIIGALMADHPYEMYWYDKTKGIGSSTSASFQSAIMNGQYYLGFGSSTALIFYLTVSSEYASDSASGTYQADTAKTGAVTAAVTTAKEIVNRHATEDDYTKLCSYRDDICELVAYNHPAADDDSTPYGNPWQLIWVFDGDTSTNVVCEGYSKAFQYLCDLSTFNSNLVECHTVTGQMTGGTGAGRHMWNIVTMDDGRNYLVDVTNSDSRSIGQSGGLFLSIPTEGSVETGYTMQTPSSSIRYIYDNDTTALFDTATLTLSQEKYSHCSHNWTEPEKTEPTCTKEGKITYTCSICQQTKTEPIAALGHEYTTRMTPPTCTEHGYTTYTCIRGDHSYEDDYTDPTGHTPELIPGKDATCTEPGLTEGSKCSVCGVTLKAQETIPALGHDYTEEKTPASCTEKGSTTHTCKRCNHSYSDNYIDPIGHTPEVIPVRDATCTDDGLTEGSKCSVCEVTLTAQEIIPALGHRWGEPVVTKEATYSSDGEKQYTCETCKETKTAVIPARKHQWSKGTVTKAATCTQTGSITYTCAECDQVRTEVIPVNPGNHVGGTQVRNARQATVEQKGYTGDTYCTSCGTLLSHGHETARLNNPATPDAKQTEKTITQQKNDNDPKGSSFSLLQAQAKTVSKNSVKVTWKKVKGANGYIIYGNLCGKGKPFKKLKTTTASSFTQKKLKKGTYYKYLVLAYKNVDGGQIILATSRTIHVATSGGKVGNWKSLKLKKKKITLKKGKTFTLKVTQTPASKKIKVKKHRKTAFESGNKKVATVSGNGKIKAVGKGKCTIYVYAQNGICTTATVTVK